MRDAGTSRTSLPCAMETGRDRRHNDRDAPATAADRRPSAPENVFLDGGSDIPVCLAVPRLTKAGTHSRTRRWRLIGRRSRPRSLRARALGALAIAVVTLVGVVTPARADLESVYTFSNLPACWPDINSCSASTWVHIVTPAEYADCVAWATEASATDQVTVGNCDIPARLDAEVLVSLIWTPGSCATYAGSGDEVYGSSLWSIGSGGYTSAPATCYTVDHAFTQTFTLAGCPGTSFQVTADVKGNADRTYSFSYSVNGSGPCATLYDVFVSEWSG